LRLAINGEGLEPSKLICDRLAHYQSIIPLNNAEFTAHANAFFGGSVPAGGHPDYGSGWYNIWLPMYDESHGTLAVEAMQDIIDLYFPEGCPTIEPIPVVTAESPTICAGDTVTLIASGASTYRWSNGATGSSITVSPSETTTYSVTGKTAGYVSDTVFVIVTVNPLPDVFVNTPSICKGQSAVLIASGADMYIWSTGAIGDSIVVSPESDTSYAVTGTSLGCSVTVESIVTVNDLPVIDLGGDIDLPAGADTILNATGNDLSYLWSTGEVTPSIHVTSAGTYSVTVTNSAGCTATDSVAVTIITSVTGPHETYTLTALPNPTHDFIDIIYSGASLVAVELIDSPGKILMSEKVLVPDGTPYRISLTDLPPGMHYIRTTTSKGFTKIIPVVKM
jgi:hypothetical protein